MAIRFTPRSHQWAASTQKYSLIGPKRHLAPGSHFLSDGLACFRAVTTANCHHKAIVTDGKHPNDLTQFRWLHTLLSNLKTRFIESFHPFNCDKPAMR